MNLPWTHEELVALRARLIEEMSEIEDDHPDIRPLPPMTKAESLGLMDALWQTSTIRPLTCDEAFMSGQLLACFEQAIRAEMLGKKGRYFVMSEDQINGMMAERP
jgi:hypothetical protein